MKNNPKKKQKTSIKQKVAIAVFMECVPSIISMWKSKAPELTFDSWLMSIYDEEMNRRKSK